MAKDKRTCWVVITEAGEVLDSYGYATENEAKIAAWEHVKMGNDSPEYVEIYEINLGLGE